MAATLINVSRDGARIAGTALTDFQVDQAVLLSSAGLRLPAVVRWTRGGMMGLQFTAPLSKPVLTRLRLGGGRTIAATRAVDQVAAP